MESIGLLQTYLQEAEATETHAALLAAKLDLGEILKSWSIIDLMDLPSVPRSALLVKGVVEGGHRPIPLVDLRMRLGASNRGGVDSASALIVGADGNQVGLIMETGCEA